MTVHSDSALGVLYVCTIQVSIYLIIQ